METESNMQTTSANTNESTDETTDTNVSETAGETTDTSVSEAAGETTSISTRVGRKKQKVKKKGLERRGLRVAIYAVTTIVLILGGFFTAVAVVNYGPSPTVRDMFVTSMLETSAAKFLATMYFSEEEIDEIIKNNQVVSTGQVTNPDMINISDGIESDDTEDIVIEEVSGDTFKGEMMIVKDPSRVFVGVISQSFSRDVRGKRVDEIIDLYDGIAGVNGGGFEDIGGVSNGSWPMGLVISEGKLLAGGRNNTYNIIGLDTDNKLIVGDMTGQEALDVNIRDALSFGPTLIVNGEPLEVKGLGGGLNPRTAIGQRADGAILLLVCDGRQANSLGATMGDIIDVMVDYGAVNAANLDGGTSTVMYYEGEMQNVCASLYGPRDIPTAVVVSK